MSFEAGLTQIGPTTWAFIQPDGGWGWSNAGFVASPDGSILVDTFIDLPLTRRLLDAVRGLGPIATLVNTHHNADHCWGNQLVTEARIVGHRRCRDDLLAGPAPAFLAGVLASPDDGGPVSYMKRAFGAFDPTGIRLTPPTIVFDETLSAWAGSTEVTLTYFGPCHTLSDIAVWVPSERVLYAGDLLFNRVTPVVWEGSIGNWASTLDRLLALEPETVVPGHGAVCGPEGLRELRGYLEHVLESGARLKEKGLTPLEAALEIELGPYEDWVDAERIALNMTRLWMELDGYPPETPVDAVEAFAHMSIVADRLGRVPPNLA